MLGQKIKQARQDAGLTQAQLAGAVLSRSLISELERNTRNPSADTIRLLAERLNKPLEYFIPDVTKLYDDEATLLINQAHCFIELGDMTPLKKVFASLDEIPAMSNAVRARFQEFLAWYEQTQGRPLSAINHALTADTLFGSLKRPDKQWYCCHVAAHEAYSAGLYEQAVEMSNRALERLTERPDLSEERRLTLYLLGSTYFALGKTAQAEQCYSEMMTQATGSETDALIQAYQGKAICAQQQGDTQEALEWSERAVRLAEKSRNRELQAYTMTTWGLSLIRMGRVHEAMSLLHRIESDPELPEYTSQVAQRDYLLYLAEQEPYPADMCLELEQKLAVQLKPLAVDYDALQFQWAITKSQLRRTTREENKKTVLEFAASFKNLSHKNRAAQVLHFGAKLLEGHGDLASAFEMLKAAYEVKG